MLVSRATHVLVRLVLEDGLASHDNPAAARLPGGQLELRVGFQLAVHVFRGGGAEPDAPVLHGGEAEGAHVRLVALARCQVPGRDAGQVVDDGVRSVHGSSFRLGDGAVSGRSYQGMKLVAARVHGRRQRFRMAERAGEQRHHERCQHAQASLRESGAAADLRAVHGLQLEGELGKKAQRDSHHHGKLVRRHADAAKGAQQVLERVGYVECCGGQGEQAHAQQEQQQTAGDEGGLPQARLADADDPPLEQHGAALHEEHVEQRGDHHDERERRDGLERRAQRNARQLEESEHESCAYRQPPKRLRDEHHGHQRERQQQLRARVHAVQRARARPVASDDGDISHDDAP